MKQCVSCGCELSEDARFCFRCGSPVQAFSQENAVMPRPDAPFPGPVFYNQQKKACTKCGAELDTDVLFCGSCGTKQYVWSQVPYPRAGMLLMQFGTSQYIRLKLMKQPGVLSVYDDKLYFQPASGAPHLLPMYELAGVYPASAFGSGCCIKVTTKKGKSYLYSFEQPEADSVPYLIGLLMNYKY